MEIMDNSHGEHFAFTTFDDRRSGRYSSRDGRTSPSHSAHGNLIRHSILKATDDKKARKVRFYRNGDRFFKGMVYAVSPERFRSFESLLVELTSSPLCDKNILPNGVRHIFSLNGSRKIQNLEQLQEGESYVCASTELFKTLDYAKTANPNWNPNVRAKEIDSGSGSARDSTINEEFRDYIKPKLVTIIRNGSKPRRAVRILLNKKTAHSFDQVLDDITEAIKLDSGAVRKIFTVDGRQVSSNIRF